MTKDYRKISRGGVVRVLKPWEKAEEGRPRRLGMCGPAGSLRERHGVSWTSQEGASGPPSMTLTRDVASSPGILSSSSFFVNYLLILIPFKVSPETRIGERQRINFSLLFAFNGPRSRNNCIYFEIFQYFFLYIVIFFYIFYIFIVLYFYIYFSLYFVFSWNYCK